MIEDMGCIRAVKKGSFVRCCDVQDANYFKLLVHVFSC
jgi:hypothetical protein